MKNCKKITKNRSFQWSKKSLPDSKINRDLKFKFKKQIIMQKLNLISSKSKYLN